MSQQNQSKSTFTLRISDGGGTFRCRAISAGAAGKYPHAALDIIDVQQSTAPPKQSFAAGTQGGAASPSSNASRLLTRASHQAGTFRINSGATMFRIAG